jgi:hypothetical protein
MAFENTNLIPSITYELGEYTESDRYVEVTYTRESDGHTFKRNVNIPHFEDGSIDQEYLNEILESQFSGVINKYKVGTIEFREPSLNS